MIGRKACEGRALRILVEIVVLVLPLTVGVASPALSSSLFPTSYNFTSVDNGSVDYGTGGWRISPVFEPNESFIKNFDVGVK